MSEMKRPNQGAKGGAKKRSRKPRASAVAETGETTENSLSTTEAPIAAAETEPTADSAPVKAVAAPLASPPPTLSRESREKVSPAAPSASSQNRPENKSKPESEPAGNSAPNMGRAAEYLIQVCFDKGARQFTATVAEFPELKVTAPRRESVLAEIERRIEQQLQNFKRRNEASPDPISARKYPERLEIAISQGLFKKLDLLSRREKVSLDQLVVELLSGAVEKRSEPQQRSHAQDNRRQQHHGGGNQESRGNTQRHGGNQQPRRNRGGYHESLENRENFLEYVRSLEKGGGNWRKK